MATSHVTARVFQAEPEDTSFGPALDHLDQLSYVERRLRRSLGGDVYAIADTASIGLGVWTLRTGVDIHEDGQIHPWNLAGDLAEGSYFRFFENGITIMVPTGHGPRTTALSRYLEELTRLAVIFNPIVRVDNVTYVTSLDDVKRIEMTLTGAPSEPLRQIDESLGSAVAGLTAATSSDKLQITIDGMDADSRDTMWSRSKDWVRSLVEALPVPGVARLHVVVRGEVSGEEDIDVLKDRISYQIEVPATRLDLETAMDVAARAYARYSADFG